MSWVAEIKEKINIVDFIQSDGITLKKESGGRWSACCPFHSEKTASFKVNEDYQNFYCFGCQESGDVIAYFAKRNLIDYYSAATILAEKLGIKVDKFDNDNIQKTKRMFSLVKSLEDFYKKEFSELTDYHPAKKQITDRGLTINGDDFGYAPSSSTKTINHLKKLGYSEDEMLSLGIINENKNVLLKDRLVFFIRNYIGKTIGFSGRELSTESSNYKYINSKNSMLYNKQLALYNIENAKEKAYKEKQIYLVEGLFDVIAMKQNGYENVVGTCGTSITELHLKEIKRCVGDGGNIILMLDGDKAGKRAMKKVFEDFPNYHTMLNIIILPNNLDPCDYFQQNENSELPPPENMLAYIYKEIKAKRSLSVIENRSLFIQELQDQFTQYITNPQLKEQYLRSGCVAAGFDYKNIKIKTKKEYITEIVTDKKEQKINISERDKYYLASLSCYVVNRDKIKGKLLLDNYPKKYNKIINEINMLSSDEPFIPEKFETFKVARAISEIHIDKLATEARAISHYKMLLEQAKKLEHTIQDSNNITNLINNIDGLEPEQVLPILEDFTT